jgi:putative SOS response-associated peptidase YedK
MPVILSLHEFRAWIDRQMTNPETLQRKFQPYPADLMEMWPVSMLVNNVRNDSPDLVVPVRHFRRLTACTTEGCEGP